MSPITLPLWSFVLLVSLLLGTAILIVLQFRQRATLLHKIGVWQNNQAKTEREKQIATDSLKAALEEQKAHQEAMDSRNKELIETNRIRTQMFSIISHDMRSPINSVLGLLNVLGEGNLQLDEAKVYANKARVRVQNTLEMLTNLLNWSRNQLDGAEIKPVKVDLNRLLARQLPIYQEIARQKKIIIENEIYEPVELYCDREMITIILRNLVSNAIKFTPAGGNITLGVVTMDERVSISVKDTGVGMDAKTKAKLFSSHLESKLGTNHEKGTGLGLKLCKNFVDLHDGNIFIDSAPNKGTTFRVVMPRYHDNVMIPHLQTQKEEASNPSPSMVRTKAAS